MQRSERCLGVIVGSSVQVEVMLRIEVRILQQTCATSIYC